MRSKLIAIAIAATFCSSATHAQLGVAKKVLPVVTVGVKVGANMQHTSGNFVSDNFATGILGGAFVGVSKNKKGIRVEGLIKSARIEFSTVAVKYKTIGLDVPVLFEYAPIKRLKLHIGPQFTTLLSAKKNGVDAKTDLASMDISAVAGAEVNLPLKLTVGARYIKGFVDMNNTGVAAAGKWTSSTVQLSVGYRFLN